jgi:hypothetical protein
MMFFSGDLSAGEYLAHRYGGDLPSLPLADEPFVGRWETWLATPGDAVPESAMDVSMDVFLSAGGVDCRLEATPAGRIPVVRTSDREGFERVAYALYPGGLESGIPASVNAFTIKPKRPGMEGHRVLLLNRAGYSGLSARDVGIPEEDWLEKAMTIRLNHEICHYLSLRVLGGMQNHALDEIAADCAGQLAAFGVFSASLQKKFFGISESGKEIVSGGRFSFYVKKLRKEAMEEVLEKTEVALISLENFLLNNPDMALEANRPYLALRLLMTGIEEIQCLR